MSQINFLTIDVEDYFQVEHFSEIIPFSDWSKHESRVVGNTQKILSILDKANAKATFFVVGWIAQNHPDLVREIYAAGHEVASHGYAHRLVYKQTPDEFREDIRKTKEILEGIIKEPVLGYRAPSYSITKNSLWAIDILLDEGFKYDSSLFPIHHDIGGFIKAERYPHKIYNHDRYMWEIPISTVRILKQNLPFSGGGYFRLLPFGIIKCLFNKENAASHPVNVYLHPWEFDPGQPRIKAGMMKTFRHYVNISKNEGKLGELLNSFKFQTIKDYLKGVS